MLGAVRLPRLSVYLCSEPTAVTYVLNLHRNMLVVESFKTLAFSLQPLAFFYWSRHVTGN